MCYLSAVLNKSDHNIDREYPCQTRTKLYVQKSKIENVCVVAPLCLSQFQLGTSPPGQPPGISSKYLPGGRDLTFESCPGAGNSTRTGLLWEMKVKLQKNRVDQIFTGENKRTSRIFGLFRGLRFSQWNLSWSMGQFFGSAITHTLQKSEELPLACLYI